MNYRIHNRKHSLIFLAEIEYSNIVLFHSGFSNYITDLHKKLLIFTARSIHVFKWSSKSSLLLDPLLPVNLSKRRRVLLTRLLVDIYKI